jgi:ubiquinone/menaquinone biosynthesis C-methylase UbiE
MTETSLEAEEAFHDQWASTIDVDSIDVKQAFEACTAPENRYIRTEMGDLTGRKVLDLGCGAGEAAVFFATQGADAVASDLSDGMLHVALRLAERNGVRISVSKSPADEIDFPDNTFDMVYAANLLHHVDIDRCLREIHRVLKPKGRLFSWDPLAHNPAINVYRRMATEVRTEDEHPLRMQDLQLFHKYFKNVRYRGTWLFSLWIFMRFYLIERVNPNDERYWKKVILEADRLKSKYERLEKLDRLALRALPWLTRYCWNITVIAEK